MYQSPQSLFEPILAFEGTVTGAVATAVATVPVVAVLLKGPPGGLYKLINQMFSGPVVGSEGTKMKSFLPQADLIANEIAGIPTKVIEIRVPGLELREGNGRIC